MPVADTVRGFKEILEGKHDDVPEGNALHEEGAVEEIREGELWSRVRERQGASSDYLLNCEHAEHSQATNSNAGRHRLLRRC